MKIKLIAFDVNGTLFDDTDIFWTAINGIFPYFNELPLPLEILQERFGQPWTKIYRDKGLHKKIVTDERLYEIYNELYRKQTPPRPFCGIRSTLQWLKKQGIKLAIVSTQQNGITIPLLKQYRLDKLFFNISGSVFDKAKTLKQVFKIAGVTPQEAAYMGDQVDDMKNATKAGCVSIAYLGGLHTRKRLEVVGPSFIITNFRELKKLPF